MSSDFIVRIIGMFVLGIAGIYWGVSISQGFPTTADVLSPMIVGLLGALAGLILTPYFTTRPARAIRALLSSVAAQTLVAGMIGLISGLVIAALFAFPISLLPSPFGEVLPFIGVLIFGYLGVAVFVMRQNDIFSVLRGRIAFRGGAEDASSDPRERNILLDTSVIIDGRILDIARTGFLHGVLLIPRFVLIELQYIADSADGLRRQRGRRGMEILSQLQKDPAVPVQISDIDIEGTREVDDKLVILARQMKCPILTNDYNLNRVAELQGVPVLNINELANSVKAVLLPGETLEVNIIQEGREHGQGVGYLEDGTMVVVEDGSDFVNHQKSVTVTKVLQTAAGRMIFARLEVITE
jgi:uncharacterized protein YacL